MLVRTSLPEPRCLFASGSSFEYKILGQNSCTALTFVSDFRRASNIAAHSSIIIMCLGNFSSSRSPFEFGYRPIMLSEKAQKERGEGWKRVGAECSYYRRKKEILRPKGVTGPTLLVDKYALSFTFEFEHSRDSVYFAVQQPYSYTQLQTLIQTLQKDVYSKTHFRRQELCRSLAGNRIELLVISEDCDTQIRKLPTANLTSFSQPSQSSGFEELDCDLGLASSGTATKAESEIIPTFIKKMQEKLNKEREQERERLQLLRQVRKFVDISSYICITL